MAFPFMAIASALKAVGSIYAGFQQKGAADYNQALLESQAEQEALEAEETRRRMRIEHEAFLSEQVARRAKSGVDPSRGSALRALSQSASRLKLRELDQLRASELKREATIRRAQQISDAGNIALTTGFAAGTSKLFQAGSQLLPVGG